LGEKKGNEAFWWWVWLSGRNSELKSGWKTKKPGNKTTQRGST